MNGLTQYQIRFVRAVMDGKDIHFADPIFIHWLRRNSHLLS